MSRGLNLLLAGAASVVAVMSPVAAAQAKSAPARSYNVPAGSMKAALDAWARQSGRQIIYRIDDVRGLRSPGVRGSYSAPQALDAILSGTTLSSRTDNSGAVAIVRGVALASNGAAPVGALPQSTAPTGASRASTPVASAQTDDAPGSLEDIVVTARRVAEPAQKVPVALTAFSQEDLRSKNINNGTDLQNYTPSLSVLGDVSRNQETFTIRGMGGTTSPGAGSGPGVVGYFAEVPSSVSGPGNFYDLASLQVLKGPQGTLFGRNTTGGAVLLEPQHPKFNTTEGYADFIYGSYNRRSLQGALNVPLVDDVLAIRLAGQMDKRDGYVTDAITGRDYLNRNNFSLRFGIQFNPSDAVTSYTAVSYLNVDEHGGGSILLAVNPTRPYGGVLQPYLTAQQARGIRSTALSTPTKEVARNLLILNNTEIKVSDALTLKNVVSYGHQQSNYATDRDSTPLPIADLYGAYPGGWNLNYRTVTEELQFRIQTGAFKLQTGGFYLDQISPGPLTFQTINPMQQAGLLGGGPLILPPALQSALGVDGPLLPAQSLQPNAHADARSKALYAQAQYAITPALTATAGYRWTWDSFGGDITMYQDPQSYQVFNSLAQLGVISQAQAAQIIGFNAGLCTFDAYQAVGAGQIPTAHYPDCKLQQFRGKSDGATWQLGLDWKADPDTLLYAVSRRGYKSGGTNPIVSLFLGQQHPLFSVRPEQVTDAEAGLKKDWRFGGVRARTNIAAFYTWYNDIQVIQRAAIAGSDILTNAQKARVLGVEFEGQLIPADWIALSGYYSYNSPKYLEYNTIAIPNIPQALTAAQPSRDLSGTPFSFVPKHKFSLNARFTLPIEQRAGDVTMTFNYAHQSSQRVTPESQPFDTIQGYGLFNMRLDWNKVMGSGFDVAVFGNNVFDTEYRVTANPSYNNSGFINSIYGEPATWGAELRYRF
jgi:iron complex outermembrane recepter protein